MAKKMPLVVDGIELSREEIYPSFPWLPMTGTIKLISRDRIIAINMPMISGRAK